MAIIISDIHGDTSKAKAFLAYKPEVEHVILGDLMDSIVETDPLALQSETWQCREVSA